MEDNNQNLDNQSEYIREKMKQRPLNRKKLMRRTIITASMAVIFGVLACFTFLVLEPVFTNLLYPEEEPEAVEIPEDTEEVLPEDMLLAEEEETESSTSQDSGQSSQDPLDDYQLMYGQVYAIANETQKSLVKVTAVNTDEDWWGEEYQSQGETSGLYVANNGKELLILTDSADLADAEQIRVTFPDNEIAAATVKGTDENTGLEVVAVEAADIPTETVDSLVQANLGNSKLDSLVASPVIAIGHPYGSVESVAFGMLASRDMTVNLVDNNYDILTTNIYGSENASGILVDLDGNVLGIIDQDYNSDDTKNLISAIGISDIKRTIERMSNGKTRARLGINGTDVSAEAHDNYGVPYGAYVTGIVMNSPAMNYGIQSGDVIVAMDGTGIETYSQFVECLSQRSPQDVVNIRLMRQSQQEYRELELEITLDEE